jgi:ubiquinone/menaquinone biosynthesis C-methylase UbiE
VVGFQTLAPVYDLFPIPTHPETVAEAIADVEGPGVDLGGGTGRFTGTLHPDREPPLLVDATPSMLARARAEDRPVHPIAADGAHLPFPDDAVGALTVTEAFHHFQPHQERVLAETARVLDPEGVLAVEEIDPDRWLGRAIELGERLIGFGSVFLTPDELAAMAEPHFGSVTVEPTGSFTYLLEAREPQP